MTIEQLKMNVRTILTGAFPTVTIQFEEIGDDPLHIGVAVYGVEANAVKWVKDRILDIDEKLCVDTDFAITPLVRDEATTEKYYPQFACAWTKPAVHNVTLVHRSVSGIAYESLMPLAAQATEAQWELSPSYGEVANDELALAA